MKWNLDNERPIYAQLVEQIEQAVAAGGYLPGAKLPGVRELAADAGVNPNTMQRALAELETRGLLVTQRTSGRFVTQDAQRIASTRQQLAQSTTTGYVQNMRALGCGPQEITQFVQDETKKIV